MTRANPPDAILREVFQRTGDNPSARINVISLKELQALFDGYKRASGSSRDALGAVRTLD